MSAADVRKVKGLAERLGVRDSDVIRFAVKSMLSKLAPLHDPMVRGRNLMPVFLEHGTELFQHFDLDASRLDTIINHDADDLLRVEPDDIQMVAMTGTRQSYVHWNLDQRPASVQRGRGDGVHGNGNGKGGHEHGNEIDGHEDRADDEPATTGSLRRYLYQKYQYPNGGGA
jgi:hypothetical protein